MRTAILTALAVLTFSASVAASEPVSGAAPQPSGTEYNMTAGAAGWG